MQLFTRTTLVSLFQRGKMRFLYVFPCCNQFIALWDSELPREVSWIVSWCTLLAWRPLIQLADIKEDKISLAKMLSNDCMCAAARRAVVIEPRVGIIGSRVCIHVLFIYFFPDL